MIWLTMAGTIEHAPKTSREIILPGDLINMETGISHEAYRAILLRAYNEILRDRLSPSFGGSSNITDGLKDLVTYPNRPEDFYASPYFELNCRHASIAIEKRTKAPAQDVIEKAIWDFAIDPKAVTLLNRSSVRPGKDREAILHRRFILHESFGKLELVGNTDGYFFNISMNPRSPWVIRAYELDCFMGAIEKTFKVEGTLERVSIALDATFRWAFRDKNRDLFDLRVNGTQFSSDARKGTIKEETTRVAITLL